MDPSTSWWARKEEKLLTWRSWISGSWSQNQSHGYRPVQLPCGIAIVLLLPWSSHTDCAFLSRMGVLPKKASMSNCWPFMNIMFLTIFLSMLQGQSDRTSSLPIEWWTTHSLNAKLILVADGLLLGGITEDSSKPSLIVLKHTVDKHQVKYWSYWMQARRCTCSDESRNVAATGDQIRSNWFRVEFRKLH